MGDGGRALRRRTRSQAETRELLRPPPGGWPVDGLIQGGLGDWAEGPVLLDLWGHLPWMAADPVHRYAHEAWRDGFRGPIIQAALWDVTGALLELSDFRSRTSVYDNGARYLGKFKTYTIALDDAVRFVRYPSAAPALWLDCEGAELTILRGAGTVLPSVPLIVIELKNRPAFPGWPCAREVNSALDDYGFRLFRRIGDNAVYVRKGIKL